LNIETNIQELEFIGSFIKHQGEKMTECYIYKLLIEDVYDFDKKIKCNE